MANIWNSRGHWNTLYMEITYSYPQQRSKQKKKSHKHTHVYALTHTCTHNGKLYSFYTKGNSIVFDITPEPWGHCETWSNPATEGKYCICVE